MAISIRIKDLPDSERPRERLVEKGAELDAKDKAGQTPLLKALAIKPPGVVEPNLMPYVSRKSTADLLLKLGAIPPSASVGQIANVTVAIAGQ